MIDDIVLTKLKQRYASVHPLIFQRSLERAKTAGELFEIMEKLPKQLPVIWSHEKKCWVTTFDLTQYNELQFANSK